MTLCKTEKTDPWATEGDGINKYIKSCHTANATKNILYYDKGYFQDLCQFKLSFNTVFLSHCRALSSGEVHNPKKVH